MDRKLIHGYCLTSLHPKLVSSPILISVISIHNHFFLYYSYRYLNIENDNFWRKKNCMFNNQKMKTWSTLVVVAIVAGLIPTDPVYFFVCVVTIVLFHDYGNLGVFINYYYISIKYNLCRITDTTSGKIILFAQFLEIIFIIEKG